MPFTVTMPKLSPTMEEGTIARWHKKEGDKVHAGDVLVEVATDKATVEYNALDEGFLRKILVVEGGHAIVNQPIAIFTESAGESVEGYQPQGTFPEEAKEKKQQEAPSVPKREAIQTAASMQQPAFTPEPPLDDYEFRFPTGALGRVAVSPLAKKMAKNKGLNLSTVKGSGPRGRITSRDLSLAQPDQTVTFGKRELPSEVPGSFEERSLTPMRKVIANRLQQAKSFIPHIYIRQTIDPSALITAREQLKTGNLAVTFNDFVIRASALALRDHQAVNSGFNSVSQSIILFKTVDISVAVTVEGGLITPIVRHADYKTLGEISLEVKELAKRAKEGQLKPEEYKGGSFTISNMGMFGITDFCAVINPPQSAILAVGGIEEVPVVKHGAVVPGSQMNLVLSADHRVLDGADAAKFLKTIQKYLENPALLFI
ncbi:MAG: pyruvate dehydrogenase complex dihydrolipoamide acetyltransferase [Chlamydiae bacterium RIFCSPHIGHO2_12_FULL_44_59]|nr:MAG: pyruvate dehydrogenase complex dihydrolipoamide acetyltransferase [Chlamydiae bacterium RIFCSPHIGHO2_01_FULL_44_39]OGN60768.1 MAG: pyruvate dehydrogenase complex dihydrolipoamide acetyltransferase [Chlamydiae bacterium RIFCSPHIGHO2_12_FULL_44_59]OGN67028.1 MAG: pyruvate dehydrogenase complex dihydrolipoamide acetyltransferase [Chlamydiae bacterium RIFCSPLOWO2_01_FULL_44_52]OGN67581.1 MAG: pyruvate dehydrogenase complex dihydrolipoamide acetyltransferase [Chlamydiae bacterium RIFCSPLOWO2_